MIFSKNKRKKTSQLRKKVNDRKINFEIESLKKIDRRLIGLTLILLAGGLLMIFSASALLSYDRYGDTFHFLKLQLMWIAVGSISMTFFIVVPLSVLKHLSTLMLAGSIVLLLYILPEALFGNSVENIDGSITNSGLQMPFVVARNGATRWIEFGSFSFQPSELVKFSFVLYLAAWLSKDFKLDQKKLSADHAKKVLIPFAGLVGTVSLLILAQRDFDTAVIMFLTLMAIYYVAGNSRIHTQGAVLLLTCAIIVGSIALVVEPYRFSRIQVFADLFINGEPTTVDSRDEAAQQWSAILGCGSGGLFGKGYNEADIKNGFLQDAAFTDSIFIVICEEFGFVGSATVTLGFLYFAIIGYGISIRAPDKFSVLAGIGATSLIAIQGLLNIAANLSLIPFGGMPLPFFTYGGTATITAMMAVGLLLNISRRSSEAAAIRSIRE